VDDTHNLIRPKQFASRFQRGKIVERGLRPQFTPDVR
jgi:hypothetical protein